jgi:hypothetical protein
VGGKLQQYIDFLTKAQVKANQEQWTSPSIPRPLLIIQELGKLRSAQSRQYATALARVFANYGVAEAQRSKFEGGENDLSASEMAASDVLTLALLARGDIGEPRPMAQAVLSPKLPYRAWLDLCSTIVDKSPSDTSIILAMKYVRRPDINNFSTMSEETSGKQMKVTDGFIKKAIDKLTNATRPPNITTISSLLAVLSPRDPSLLMEYAAAFNPPSGHDIQDIVGRAQKQLQRELSAFPDALDGNPIVRSSAYWRDLDHTIVATYDATTVIVPFIEALNAGNDEVAKHYLIPSLQSKVRGLLQEISHGEPIFVRAIYPSPSAKHEVLVETTRNIATVFEGAPKSWNEVGPELWITVRLVGREWRISQIRNILK